MVRNTIPICRISVSSTVEAVPEKMKDQSANYPKVKVREEENLDDRPVVYEQKRSYLLSLKDLESLFLQDSSNTPGKVKEHRVSLLSCAKIPKACSTNEIKPSTSEPQESERSCTIVDEDNKANIRASSIPMPRAVVSSPENDQMIGKKNRKTTEKPSVLKNCNSVQSRHSQCKIIARHSANENSISSRRSKDTTDSKCRSVGKNGTTYRGGSFMSKTTP
ncbi:uncharacterized protein LOC101203442 [Cucumis sativus]|uniref:Uncharacterized protein n=1 Tax=Cucumis sativus TaxID=3659 RepID=A0A0A0L861_CUCSA|nr:uncharacterized protein LOC101203442 [Cucumis sativus]KGN56812.1 hypothetical protein Csa_011253 [Cucumis sativus]